MQTRFPLATLTFAVLLAVACGEGTKEESPGEVLARDSSLASELRQADTSAFAEAADVAMSFDPDSAMPPATAAPRPAPTTKTAPADAETPSATPAVPMRVDRSASPTPAPTPPPAVNRAPMRPAPATIHPDPIPTRTLPAAPDRRTGAASGGVSASSPNAVAILERVPGASLPPAGSDAPCSSPAAVDQRRCLMLHLARSDVALDHTYQSLIAAMKREAGTPPGGKEPASVEELRVAQRAWLVYRDTECRRRNRGKEGPLWAPVRAQCLGEFSGTREEELARALRERAGR